MSKKWQGVFLFYEWLDALNTLPAKTAMTIINNIRQYQTDGTEPPPLRGQGAVIQHLMLSYEQRSKQASEYGRMGAEIKRLQKERSMASGANASPPIRDVVSRAEFEAYLDRPCGEAEKERELTLQERKEIYDRLLRKQYEQQASSGH